MRGDELFQGIQAGSTLAQPWLDLIRQKLQEKEFYDELGSKEAYQGADINLRKQSEQRLSDEAAFQRMMLQKQITGQGAIADALAGMGKTTTDGVQLNLPTPPASNFDPNTPSVQTPVPQIPMSLGDSGSNPFPQPQPFADTSGMVTPTQVPDSRSLLQKIDPNALKTIASAPGGLNTLLEAAKTVLGMGPHTFKQATDEKGNPLPGLYNDLATGASQRVDNPVKINYDPMRGTNTISGEFPTVDAAIDANKRFSSPGGIGDSAPKIDLTSPTVLRTAPNGQQLPATNPFVNQLPNVVMQKMAPDKAKEVEAAQTENAKALSGIDNQLLNLQKMQDDMASQTNLTPMNDMIPKESWRSKVYQDMAADASALKASALGSVRNIRNFQEFKAITGGVPSPDKSPEVNQQIADGLQAALLRSKDKLRFENDMLAGGFQPADIEKYWEQYDAANPALVPAKMADGRSGYVSNPNKVPYTSFQFDDGSKAKPTSPASGDSGSALPEGAQVRNKKTGQMGVVRNGQIVPL